MTVLPLSSALSPTLRLRICHDSMAMDCRIRIYEAHGIVVGAINYIKFLDGRIGLSALF